MRFLARRALRSPKSIRPHPSGCSPPQAIDAGVGCRCVGHAANMSSCQLCLTFAI
jgi:hypothetical protein